jgi:integrase
MPRTASNPRIVNRTVRAKLPQRRDPYWHLIAEGQHLGYRKGATGGTWIARIYDTGRGRRFESLGAADDVIDADGRSVLSFQQAQEKARVWFGQLAQIESGEVQGGSYTVAQAMADYVANQERVKRKSQYRTNALVKAHILPTLGHIELAKLTHGKVKTWRDALAETAPRVRTRVGKAQKYRTIDADSADTMRKRQATANRILTVLKAALNFAHEERRVASKAAWEAVKPFRKVDVPKVRFLTADEVTALVAACSPDFQSLVKGALLTGCRYGELTAMTVKGFNDEDGKVYVAESKNGEARYVDLNNEGVEFFAELSEGRAQNDRLFLRSNGKAWKTSEQQRPMDDACTAAKLEDVTFHILRHTYASHAVMNGMPIGVLSEHLGHKDTRITERHYAHLCQSYKQKLVRANAPSFGFGGGSAHSDGSTHAESASEGTTGRVVSISAGQNPMGPSSSETFRSKAPARA